jgi:hypothetical protein
MRQTKQILQITPDINESGCCGFFFLCDKKIKAMIRDEPPRPYFENSFEFFDADPERGQPWIRD